jgi:hypothetical protein
MKPRSFSVLILAAALGVLALVPSSATAGNAPAVGYNVSDVRLPSDVYDFLVRGTSRAEVKRTMGQPSRELSPDIWLYSGYRPILARANEQGCNLLVVTFDHDTVVDLKFVNQSAVQVIVAALKNQRSEFYALNIKSAR